MNRHAPGGKSPVKLLDTWSRPIRTVDYRV